MFIGMASCAFLHFGMELYHRHCRKRALQLDTAGGDEGLPSAVLSPGYASSLPVRSPDGKGSSSPLLNMAQEGPYGAGPGALAAAEPPQEESKVTWKLLLLIAVPTVFDLIATTLAGIGLLWTSVSVYQMLRGALPVKILRRTFVDWKARRCTDSHCPGFSFPRIGFAFP